MSHPRKKLAALVFVVAVPLAILLVLRSSAPAEKQIAAIRASGLPVSAADADAWYSPVPVRENRALAVLEAALAYAQPAVDADPNSKKLGSLAAGSKLSPQMIQAIEAHLAANRVTIELLHKAARLPESRYPIDLSRGFGTLLPHLAQIKSLVFLLRLEAVQCSLQGKVGDAVRALETALALAESLRNEPILVSEMVRLQCLDIVVSGLERLLNEHRLSGEQLARLAAALVGAVRDCARSFHRAMIGERAIAIAAFAMSFREMEGLSSGASSDAADSLGPLGFQFYRAIGAQKRDLVLYLRMMDRLIDAAQQNFPEALQKSKAVNDELMAFYSSQASRFRAVTRQLVVPLTDSFLEEASIVARLRCATAALAIERFRLAHDGALPATIGELAPAWLSKTPSDPFDGGPLAYERLTPAGYQLASTVKPDSGKSAPRHSEHAPFVVRR